MEKAQGKSDMGDDKSPRGPNVNSKVAPSSEFNIPNF